MTYYIDMLQVAIRGDAEVLRSLDFKPAMENIRNEECDWVNDKRLEDGWLCYVEAQTKLPKSGPAVLLAQFNSATMVDLLCMNKILEDHPDLQCAAVAEIRWESEYELPTETYTFCNEEPGEGLCYGSEITDGYPLSPSVLELEDYTGKTHTFTAKSLAEALRNGTPDLDAILNFPPEELEEKLNWYFLDVQEGEPSAIHVCLSPEGALRLKAYQPLQNPKQARTLERFEEGDAEAEELLALYQKIFQDDSLRLVEEGEGRNYRFYVLDGDGNQYFLYWEWRVYARPSDWGFPEDWDWVSFAQKEYFPLPTLSEEDAEWFGEDDFEDEDD